MTELVGNLSLAVAVLVATGALLSGVVAARVNLSLGLRAARLLIVALWLMLTVAGAMLLVALETSDFRFAYVASYTERSLPAGFKFAALWAGQEGSLLLWAWLLSMLSVFAVIGWRRESSREVALAHGALAFIGAFFAALILFAANPFELSPGGAPADGRGLNPQLQDLAMIIHPPLLFTGYAGCAIPFAMLIGVLAAGRDDDGAESRGRSSGGRDRWLGLIRRWALFSWMFLGAGILMGAWWAYIELGWGGYWAWDPVENASLLPWLTSTALLHSIIVQQHRGMFRMWNANLIMLTFVLCILGTYITRSGVIESVHAFAESLIGTFFLVFLGCCAVVGWGLIAWRRESLRPDRALEGVVSREGAFLAGNVLLMIMMLVTLVGTIFPLISGLFTDQGGITVKAGFYNRVVAPMAILLVGLMAIGPALAFGLQAARKIAFNLRLPALAVMVVTGAVLLLVTHNFWALLCVAIVTLGTATVLADFARVFSSRQRSTGEGVLTCAVRVIDKDHRRYGGQLSHLGVMMIVIGVAGSSLFHRESMHRVRPGETFAVDGYSMRFVALEDVRGSNYSAVQATLELTESDGSTRLIHPQVRFFDLWSDQPNTEVAIQSSWREDLYVTLAGWEQGGTIAALQVRVNPLMLWIWLGGMLMVAGAIFCLLPRILPLARVAETKASEDGADAQLSPQPAMSVGVAVATRNLEVSA